MFSWLRKIKCFCHKGTKALNHTKAVLNRIAVFCGIWCFRVFVATEIREIDEIYEHLRVFLDFSPIKHKYNNMLNNNHTPIAPELEIVAKKIVDAAYTVHKNLGPGLLEKVYEICFCYELGKRGLSYSRQMDIPIKYDDLTFNEGLRLDVLVEGQIICEIKAIENVNPVWEAQVLSYLKMTGCRLGFLINFNVVNIGSGIRRLIL